MTTEATRTELDEIRRTLEVVVGIPTTTGNTVDVLHNGGEIFPAMLEAIEQAERAIDFVTFIYWSGDIGKRFASALAAKARDGLRVRVLLDALGSKPIDDEMVSEMTDAGCDVRKFRPVLARHPVRAMNRTHRKLLICDAAVGFTGGVGIADQWDGDARSEDEWRDTHFRVRGPAVDGLLGAFIDNWNETELWLFDPEHDLTVDHDVSGPSTVQVLRGSSEPGWNDISTAMRTLIRIARRRLRITTAYFVPDDALIEYLKRAAGDGVEVQILVPGPHADKRFVQLAGEACYRELMDHGIEIWSYQTSMLHAKVLTIDGLVATVGSANFNNRSTALDEEVNLVLFDPDITRTLDEHFDEDLAKSERLDPSRWRRRGPAQRALEQTVRIIEPWM